MDLGLVRITIPPAISDYLPLTCITAAGKRQSDCLNEDDIDGQTAKEAG